MRIAALVVGAEDATDQRPARRRQRRLDGEAFVDPDRPANTPQMGHQRQRRQRVLVVARIAEDVEDAAGELVVGDAGGRPHQGELVAAVQRDAQRALDVDGDARPPAVGEEAQAPRPQCRIEAQVEQQRRIVAAQPLERLPRCGGRCPRRGMVGRDLAAVGEAGLQCRARLAVDDHDLRAGAGQEIGGGDADHARAQDHHRHARRPSAPRRWC